MSVDVGSKAPDFTLMNQERQPVTLSQQPSGAIPSGTTSCPASCSPTATERAELIDTSCSTLRPPKTRPTRLPIALSSSSLRSIGFEASKG